MNKTRNEKGEVTTDNAEIQRSIRDYYEQLYANKMDNLEEMDRFLDLPRLNQEEIEIINTPVTSTEVKTVKSLGQDDITGEFCQTFRELISILLKPSQRTAEEGILPNSFFETTITPYQNQRQRKKRKLQTNH